MFDNEFKVKILDPRLQSAGRLVINLWPTDSTGELDRSPLEEEIKSPDDLIGQTIYFYIDVIEALELPEDLCKDPFIWYNFY